MTTIHTINLGTVNCYLLKSDTSNILVDTGNKAQYKRIEKAIKALYISPMDIDLIVLTHSHDDHTGSLYELRQHTHAKLIMSQIEYLLWTGEITHDIKSESLLANIVHKYYDIFGHKNLPEPITPDILFENEFDLSEFGIDGKLLLTPGHTKGSVCLLLNDGRVLLGDHLMALMPWNKPGKPIIAYNLDLIKSNIQMLIQKGATDFYLSHGKNYDTNTIQRALTKF